MKRIIAPLVCVALLGQGAYSQEIASFDGLGSVWTLKGNSVVKVSLDGKVVNEYSSRELGLPSLIDAKDPFRILVFSALTQRAVILGNNAAALGNPISFNALSLGQITQMCRSSQGGIWAYSVLRKELIYFDNSFTQTGHRISINKLGYYSDPTCIKEEGGVLYLAFDQRYIARISSYGRSLPPHKIEHSGVFAIQKQEIWVKRNGQVNRFSITDALPITPSLKCAGGFFPFVSASDTICFDGMRFFAFQKVNFLP